MLLKGAVDVVHQLARGGVIALIASLLTLLLAAAPAGAATDVYPPGGGTFAGDEQGWQVTEEACSVSLLSTCTASGEYDPAGGNPAGSMTAKTIADLNLLGTFESTVVFESPQFTVADPGAATLHLDREFVPGGLIELAPLGSYVVTLNDVTGGTGSVPLEEEVADASAFTGKDAVATVVAGHAYTISVEAKASSTVTLNLLVDGEPTFASTTSASPCRRRTIRWIPVPATTGGWVTARASASPRAANRSRPGSCWTW